MQNPLSDPKDSYAFQVVWTIHSFFKTFFHLMIIVPEIIYLDGKMNI